MVILLASCLSTIVAPFESGADRGNAVSVVGFYGFTRDAGNPQNTPRVRGWRGRGHA